MPHFICKFCNKDFEPDQSKRNWQSTRYCSDECKRGGASALERAKYVPRPVKPRDCIYCGESFVPNKHNSRQRFCTKECSDIAFKETAHDNWVKSRKEKKCAHCGDMFFPSKFSSNRQIYCGPKCRDRAIHRRHDKKNRRSPAYQKAFKIVRPVVLERDKVCILCGSDERLQVHHLDNSGRGDDCNNSLDNLAVLCGDCHSAIHKVTLAKVDGEWCLDGRIFDVVGLDGPIPIKT